VINWKKLLNEGRGVREESKQTGLNEAAPETGQTVNEEERKSTGTRRENEKIKGTPQETVHGGTGGAGRKGSWVKGCGEGGIKRREGEGGGRERVGKMD